MENRIAISSILMSNLIQFSSDYDLVNPSFYDKQARDYGGNLLAETIGDLLQEHIAVSLGDSPRILDIATGTGLIARYLKQRFGYPVEGVDLSQEMLTYLHKQDATIPVKKGDMNKKLPYHSESFDAVVTHWANRFVIGDTIVKEALRLLRPGGIFIWPFALEEKETWKNIAQDTLQPASPEEFVPLLRKVGFAVSHIHIPKPEKFHNTQISYPTEFLIARKL